MPLTAPRLTPWGDCIACQHVSEPWHCAEPEHYPVPVAIALARSGSGWRYIQRDPNSPPPTLRRLDLSRPYHDGGACGPSARLFALRTDLA